MGVKRPSRRAPHVIVCRGSRCEIADEDEVATNVDPAFRCRFTPRSWWVAVRAGIGVMHQPRAATSRPA
jgi:hypothetical protein